MSPWLGRCGVSQKHPNAPRLSTEPNNPHIKPGKTGRSGEIRTPDPLLPKQVRYQAALHSVWLGATYIDKRLLPRNQGLPGGRMSGRPGNCLRRGRYHGQGTDIAAKEASGYGPPRLAAREESSPRTGSLQPKPISEDGFHWGVAKR